MDNFVDTDRRTIPRTQTVIWTSPAGCTHSHQSKLSTRNRSHCLCECADSVISDGNCMIFHENVTTTERSRRIIASFESLTRVPPYTHTYTHTYAALRSRALLCVCVRFSVDRAIRMRAHPHKHFFVLSQCYVLACMLRRRWQPALAGSVCYTPYISSSGRVIIMCMYSCDC